MTDTLISRFFRGIVSLGMGNLSIMVFGLIGVMLVARLVPAKTYGSFVLIQLTAMFLIRISSFGLNLAVPKFLTASNETIDQRRIVNSSIYFRLATIALVSTLALLARNQLGDLLGEELGRSLFIYVSLLYFWGSIGQLMGAILQGLFQFNRIAQRDFIASLLGFIFLVVLVAWLELGLTGLVGAKVLAAGIANLYAYFSISTEKRLEFDYQRLREIIVFGLPLQLNDILSFIFLRIDTIMIGALLGPAQVAFYEIARKLPESISGLYEAFRSVYFTFMASLFARSEYEMATAVLNNSLRLISFATMTGAIVVLLWGQEIIRLLFSDQYLESASAFLLLMFGLGLAFIDYTLGYSLVARGDSDKPVMINVGHTTVSLIGNLTLIPRFGINGAAWTYLLGFAAVNPLSVFFLRRRSVAVNMMAYGKPIALFGVIWLLNAYLQPVEFWSKLAVLGVFFALCFVFSVITLKDIRILVQEVNRLFSRSVRQATT